MNMITRRSFLAHTPLIALAPTVPTFLWKSAQAATGTPGERPDTGRAANGWR